MEELKKNWTVKSKETPQELCYSMLHLTVTKNEILDSFIMPCAIHHP